MVRPSAASSRTGFSDFAGGADGLSTTVNEVAMLEKTSRMRFHSSTRRIPSRITGVTGVS